MWDHVRDDAIVRLESQAKKSIELRRDSRDQSNKHRRNQPQAKKAIELRRKSTRDKSSNHGRNIAGFET